jgi:hypothetical protein
VSHPESPQYNPFSQAQASRAIGATGSAGKAAVPVLLKNLNKPRQAWQGDEGLYVSVVLADMAALGTLAPEDCGVVKALLKLAKPATASPDYIEEEVCIGAVNALRQVGQSRPGQRKQIAPGLVAVLEAVGEGNPDQRQRICLATTAALGSFGPDAREAVPALRKMKLSAHMWLREAARLALANLASSAKIGSQMERGISTALRAVCP